MLDVTKLEHISHSQTFSVTGCFAFVLILPLITHGSCGFCGTMGFRKDLTKEQLAGISALVKGGKKNKEISAITGLPL